MNIENRKKNQNNEDENTKTMVEEEVESQPLVKLSNTEKTSGVAELTEAEDAASKVNEIVFWIFMLFLASVTMTVGNKYVMKKWDFANTLTLLQNGTAVLYLFVGRQYGFLEMKAFAAQQWKVFAVSSFLLSMQILTSLKALPLVAIATVVTFRNMCTVVIAIIDNVFFGTHFSTPMIMGLVTTTFGMIIYASRDVNFSSTGYMWLFFNSIATIINTFWNKIYITKYTKELKIQTSYGVSFIQQVETIPIVLTLAIANNERNALSEIVALPAVARIVLLATCCGGVLIGIAYPKCFSLVSGTSVVVASTANKAVSILLGMYIFGTVLSPMQVVGLLICISGSLFYALESRKSKK